MSTSPTPSRTPGTTVIAVGLLVVVASMSVAAPPTAAATTTPRAHSQMMLTEVEAFRAVLEAVCDLLSVDQPLLAVSSARLVLVGVALDLTTALSPQTLRPVARLIPAHLDLPPPGC